MGKCTYKIKGARVTPEELDQAKGLKFNYLNMTVKEKGLSTIGRLFSKDNKTVKRGKDEMHRAVKDRIDIKNTVSYLTDHKSDASKTLQALNPDNASDEVLLNRAIAMKHVLADIAGMEDLIEARNLDKNTKLEDKLKLLRADGGTASLARIQRLIGKEVYESKGAYLKGGALYNNAVYVNAGKQVIDSMEEAGILETTDNGHWITAGIRDVDDKSPIQTGRTVRLSKDTKVDTQVLLSTLKQVARVTLPQKERLIGQEKREFSDIHHDSGIKIDSGVKRVLDSLHSGAFSISPQVKSILGELHELFTREGEDGFKKELRNKYSQEFLEEVIGLNNPSDKELYYDSQRGESISKMTPLITMMQHYDPAKLDELYLSYFEASTGRAFQDETQLNAQQDKHMARQILEASIPIEYEGDEITEFAKRIAAEYDVPVDVITGKNTTMYPVLEEYLDVIDSEDGSINLLNNLLTDRNEVGVKAKKIWELHKVIRAIKDVRKAKDGKMESKFLGESDATASGLLLQMLENSDVPFVQELIKKLGFNATEDQVFDELISNDAYGLGVSELSKAIELAKEGKKNTAVPAAGVAGKLIDLMKLDVRELLKMPIMTFMYGQTAKNNKITFGKDMTKAILDRKDKKLLADVMELYEIDGEPKFDKATQTKLENKLAETTGSYLVTEILDKHYQKQIFDNTDVKMAKIFKVLEELPLADTDGKNIKFMNVVHVLNEVDRKGGLDYAKSAKYRVTADKLYETIEVTPSGEQSVVQRYFPNEIGLGVLMTHSKDAAVILRAVDKAHEKIAKTMGGREADAFKQWLKDNPILSIHDALMLPPKWSEIFEDSYEQEIIHASIHYNNIEMLIEEVKYRNAGSLTIRYEDGTINEELTKELEDLDKDTQKAVREKTKFLLQGAQVLDQEGNVIEGAEVQLVDGRVAPGQSIKYAVLKNSFRTDLSNLPEATEVETEGAIEKNKDAEIVEEDVDTNVIEPESITEQAISWDVFGVGTEPIPRTQEEYDQIQSVYDSSGLGRKAKPVIDREKLTKEQQEVFDIFGVDKATTNEIYSTIDEMIKQGC